MSWVKRNRWGLILLIPAMLLALIGNSSRVQVFWLPEGNKFAETVPAGQTLSHSGTTEDFDGVWQTAFTVSVKSVTPVDAPRRDDGSPAEVKTPTGSRWYAVTLHVTADPRVVVYCDLSLVDAAGHEAKYLATGIGNFDLGYNSCTSTEAPGPTSGDAQHPQKVEVPRPPAYDLTRYVLTADDFTPTQARIMLIGEARYFAYDLPGAR